MNRCNAHISLNTAWDTVVKQYLPSFGVAAVPLRKVLFHLCWCIYNRNRLSQDSKQNYLNTVCFKYNNILFSG